MQDVVAKTVGDQVTSLIGAKPRTKHYGAKVREVDLLEVLARSPGKAPVQQGLPGQLEGRPHARAGGARRVA